ncbi:hypothetical protein BH10BAC5_BH10BAC5_26360 [soil metagenome]
MFNLLSNFRVIDIQRTFPQFLKKDTITENSIGAAVDISLFSNVYTLLLPSEEATDSLLLILNDSSMFGIVLFAEKNYCNVDSVLVSNDPGYSSQWYLKNTGQGSGVANKDIHIEPVWNLTRGNSLINIGVLDVGVYTSHSDFGTRVSGDPPQYFNSSHSHGTMIAGIIGATQNNGSFISGINGLSNIYSYRILDVNEGGTQDKYINLQEFANKIISSAQQCRIVNYSNRSQLSEVSAVVLAAFSYYSSFDVAVITAMGNNNGNNRVWPTSFNNNITIGATKNDGNVAEEYSNYGPWIDIVAPGGTEDGSNSDQIYSLGVAGSTSTAQYSSGTSFSALVSLVLYH